MYSLFDILKPVAARQCNQVILREDGLEEVLTWENMLDKEYHIFAGVKYRFKVHDNSKYYDLKMTPPVNGNKVCSNGVQSINCMQGSVCTDSSTLVSY